MWQTVNRDYRVRSGITTRYHIAPGHDEKPSASRPLTRVSRPPKEDARQLLILRTMGPSDYIPDFLDTEGRELPDGVFVFSTFRNLAD